MLKNLLIPRNFNPEQLIADKLALFNQQSGITAQNLAYICHCIYSKLLIYKSDYYGRKFKNGYVPLCARYLKNIVPEYDNCIGFLIAQGIIMCDNIAIPKVKCRGYTLAKKYTGNGIKEMPIKGNLKYRLAKFFDKENEESIVITKPILKRRKFLLDKTLLSAHFTIDSLQAKVSIREKYHEYSRAAKKNLRKTGNHSDYNKKIKQLNINRDVFLHLVKQINDKSFETIIDAKGQRYHSPITRLPKYLRKHILYNGEHLFAWDLKNSQPYFSLLLLQKAFYRKKGGIGINKLDSELYELLWGGTGNKSPIMLQEIRETLANTGDGTLQKYQDDVLGGILYDRFIDVPKNHSRYQRKRDSIKKRFLTALYKELVAKEYANKLTNEYVGAFKVFEILKSVKTGRQRISKRNNRRQNKLKKAKLNSKQSVRPIFNAEEDLPSIVKLNEPTEAAVTNNKPIPKTLLVDDGYTKLATLLQRVESYLLLDVICKKLVLAKPNMPIVTVHDSIATTKEYSDFVHETILETLTEIIGFPPKLEPEIWDNFPESIN